MSLEQGFDLTKIGAQLLQQVPLWFIAWAIYRAWRANSKKQNEMLEKRLKGLEENQEMNRNLIHQSVQTIYDKLNLIQMEMVKAGIGDLKKNLDELKEFRTESKMKHEAAFRAIDELKARYRP